MDYLLEWEKNWRKSVSLYVSIGHNNSTYETKDGVHPLHIWMIYSKDSEEADVKMVDHMQRVGHANSKHEGTDK